MPLRIAFDLDGVFADMEGELARQAEALFGEPVTDPSGDGSQQSAVGSQQSAVGSRQSPVDRQRSAVPPTSANTAATPRGRIEEPPLAKLRMTARQQRRLWNHVETIDNFWETLREIEPGSIAGLAALAAERRWEIIFLTRRPATAGATSQVQSQRWLKAKGFALPSVFVVQSSRGRIATSLALDFVVDDTPENCLDVVVDSKARAILVWRDEREQVPAAAKRLGIGVVGSVEECLNILSQIDANAQEKPGVMTRFMRLLGLGEAEGL